MNTIKAIMEFIRENINWCLTSMSNYWYELERSWSTFESLNGLTKLACSMIISSSLILCCIFGLILNLYGNNIINKFNLKETYPNVAIFILNRIKLSKYYLLSNIIIIILLTFMNMFFCLAIFSSFL